MTPPAKRCPRCQLTLPAEAFYGNPRMRDGLHSWCKRCTVAATRRWRAANREALNAARRVDYPPRACVGCGEPYKPPRVDSRHCCPDCRSHDRSFGAYTPEGAAIHARSHKVTS